MKKRLLLIIIAVFLLAGCHVVSEDQNTSTKSITPKIASETTKVSGILLNSSKKPLAKVDIHFAQVYRQKKSAAFLFDSGNSPSTITGIDGSFSIKDLAAGEYVLIVGNPTSKYVILKGDDGTQKVIVAQGGEALDLGSMIVQYP
jgi:hypothetical protein